MQWANRFDSRATSSSLNVRFRTRPALTSDWLKAMKLLVAHLLPPACSPQDLIDLIVNRHRFFKLSLELSSRRKGTLALCSTRIIHRDSERCCTMVQCTSQHIFLRLYVISTNCLLFSASATVRSRHVRADPTSKKIGALTGNIALDIDSTSPARRAPRSINPLLTFFRISFVQYDRPRFDFDSSESK